MADAPLDTLKAIHAQVRRRFTQWRDRDETWRMPPPGYDGNQLLIDDCDGFCLACRALLRRAGIASRLVYCEYNSSGHLVVEVQGWILDNRQRTVVPNTLLTEYRWKRISGYEPGEPWREVVIIHNNR